MLPGKRFRLEKEVERMKIKRDSDRKEDKNLMKEVKSYSETLIRVRDEQDAVMAVNKLLEEEIQSLEDQKENLF